MCIIISAWKVCASASCFCLQKKRRSCVLYELSNVVTTTTTTTTRDRKNWKYFITVLALDWKSSKPRRNARECLLQREVFLPASWPSSFPAGTMEQVQIVIWVSHYIQGDNSTYPRCVVFSYGVLISTSVYSTVHSKDNWTVEHGHFIFMHLSRVNKNSSNTTLCSQFSVFFKHFSMKWRLFLVRNVHGRFLLPRWWRLNQIKIHLWVQCMATDDLHITWSAVCMLAHTCNKNDSTDLKLHF